MIKNICWSDESRGLKESGVTEKSFHPAHFPLEPCVASGYIGDMENGNTEEAETMTPETKALFIELAADAGNWSGTPLLDITKEQRGNLSDLKKRGLIETFKDEGCDWVDFTDDGKRLAAEFGYSI